MATTLTSADAALKEVYQPGIHDQLESSIKTVKRIERTVEGVTNNSVGGKYVRFATRVKRNHGHGARLEMEVLPKPATQQYADGQVDLSYQYGTVQLSGQALELASSDSQAFATILDQEVNGMQQGLAKDLNRQMYEGVIGTLATANAAGTTTTLVTSNGDAIWLEIGHLVDVFDLSAGAFLTPLRVEITNIQFDTPSAGQTTVTFGTALSLATASGDTIHISGSRNKETEGFESIIAASGTIFNINPTTFPVWTAEVDDPGSAQSITEGRMIAMVDRIDARGGGMPTVMFTSKGVRRAYFALLQQDRNIVNTQKFEGGFTGLAFTTDDGDIPLVSDNDCPVSTMWFVNEDVLKIHHAGDWDWMNFDGNRWQRVIATDLAGNMGFIDAYQATLFRYLQLTTVQRNSHGVIKNIIEG